MNDHQRKCIVGDSSQKAAPLTSELCGQSLSEQTMTPVDTTLMVAVVRGIHDTEHFQTGFHWTVRCKMTTMSDRTTSILLKVLVSEMLVKGIDFTGYISVEYLVNRLMRGKLDPLEIRDERDRQACLLGTLIIASVKGTWLNMYERVPVSTEVFHKVFESGWLPSLRTLKSWKEYHQPRRFLEILTVPLDTYIEDGSSRVSQRYSSYCKGYGNGGHLSRIQKTRYDSELDGDSTEKEPPEYNLLEIEQYCQILLEIEREKILRQSERE